MCILDPEFDEMEISLQKLTWESRQLYTKNFFVWKEQYSYFVVINLRLTILFQNIKS